MKPCLVKLTSISGCALMVLPALAQSAAPPSRTTATTPDKAPASVAKALASASNVKGAALASATTVAVGSVIVLADGIVANSTITQIHAPAPWFVYERCTPFLRA